MAEADEVVEMTEDESGGVEEEEEEEEEEVAWVVPHWPRRQASSTTGLTEPVYPELYPNTVARM